jgi:mevalonate pyrophosphate decarboxylase
MALESKAFPLDGFVHETRMNLRLRPSSHNRHAGGALTANAGLAAISELCDRLGVIEALDAAVGPVKQRELIRNRARGGSSSCGAAGQLATDS